MSIRLTALLVAVLLCASCGTARDPVPTPTGSVTAAKAGGKPVVVALGDSVPAGSVCGCVPFPTLYAQRLSPAGRTVMLAQGGFTSADVLSQVDDAANAATLRTASIVLIMAGANDVAAVFEAGGAGTADYLKAAAQVRANLTATLTRIRQLAGATVPIVVLGYWNVVEDGDVGRADYGAAGAAEAITITGYTNDAISAATTAGNARYLPTTALFKGADGTADPTGLLAADGDHPNAAGHAAIAAAVYAAEPTVPAA
jgi:lysophospholipase L1-like esterase